MSSAATEAAILAAAGRVTDPLRPLPFAFAKRHGVLVRSVADDGADVVIRKAQHPLRSPKCGVTCAVRCDWSA